MVESDVMVYPDFGKIGGFAGAAPGGSKEKSTCSKFLRGDAEVVTTKAKSSVYEHGCLGRPFEAKQTAPRP
jgi:hypothetical protein